MDGDDTEIRVHIRQVHGQNFPWQVLDEEPHEVELADDEPELEDCATVGSVMPSLTHDLQTATKLFQLPDATCIDGVHDERDLEAHTHRWGPP